MNKIKHLPVNWTDGMKISQKHLWDTYFNSVESIKNYSSVWQNKFNFGVLSPLEKFDALNLEVNNDSSNTIVIKLKSCNLITSAGYRIIFYPKLYGDEFPTTILNSKDISKESQFYYIVATVNPFEMVPIGIPNPDIEPLYHPSALPKIRLHVVDGNEMSSSFISEYHLIIGRLINTNVSLHLDERYIPPVVKNRYHLVLDDLCESLSHLLFKVKDCAFQVYKRNKNNPKSSRLADNTFILCDDILNFYAEKSFYLRNIIKDDSPVVLVELFSSLASHLSVSLNMIDEKEREMLLQYYYEWTDIKPYRFIEVLSQIINIQYDHTDINNAIEKLRNFMSLLDILFKKMSELEYIGQRKDNIVISEDSQEYENERKKNWNIID